MAASLPDKQAYLQAVPPPSPAVPAGLALAALLFDISTPRGIAGGIVYVGLVFCARWYQAAKAPYLFAIVADVLIFAGFYFKPPSAAIHWMVVTNRLLCAGVVWFVAILVIAERRRDMRLHAARQHSMSLLHVLTNSDDAIVTKSIDGTILSWNRGAERLFGYAASEMIGRSIGTIIPVDRGDEEAAILARLLRGESIDRLDTQRLRRDGSVIDVSVSITPVRDEDGNVAEAIKIARDISDRKGAELALRQSEQRYALAVQGMSIGVWEWEITADRLTLSPRFREIAGLEARRMPPAAVSIASSTHSFAWFEQRLHPADRSRVLERLDAHLQRREPFNMEFRLETESGRFIWIHACGQAIWDAEKQPVRMVGSIDDITERRRNEEKFRLIVQQAPYALLMADSSGVIQLVNRQAVEMFGWSQFDLVGEQVEKLIPMRYRRQHPAHRAVYFSAPETIDAHARAMGKGQELYGLRRDGSEIPVEIGFLALETDGEILVLCSVLDLTERRRIEEQYRQFNEILERQVAERTEQLVAANSDLEQFAFIASHDLKAPLRVIDNASKWLEEDLAPHLNDDTRESMELLRGRVHRMEKLLDDLLEYFRIGRKQDASYAERVRGDVLMENILELLAPPAEFQVEVDPSFAAITVPRMPLQQILFNLIGNALKHHDKANGRIEVKVQPGDADDLFTVRDDGPGIAPRYHEEVFKMFQTLKPRDQAEGSGMGLAVVRRQIESLGGTIALESDTGQGCLFRFTLPHNARRKVSAA